MPNVPYPYKVNWHLVTGNGSLILICSLSKRSLSPSLTVNVSRCVLLLERDPVKGIVVALYFFKKKLDMDLVQHLLVS